MLLKEIIRTPEFGRLMEEVNNYKHPIALLACPVLPVPHLLLQWQK